MHVLLCVKCVLSYSSRGKSGSTLVIYHTLCFGAGWVLSWRPVFFQASWVYPNPPGSCSQRGHWLHREQRLHKAPINPITAICTAVIIINKFLHKFQQMKSCYFILPALSLRCAAESPGRHWFWLIFVEMRFKEEPNDSSWEHSSPPTQPLFFCPLSEENK